MNEFEIYQLLIMNLEALNNHFEFWMTATFAVVVASYTAADRLAVWARVAVSALYLLAACLFYVRWQGSVSASGHLIESLYGLGYVRESLPMGNAVLAGNLREILMLFGTGTAVVLICMPGLGRGLKARQEQ